MSVVQTSIEIEYPETDGKPLGETDLHRGWMQRIEDLMRHRYRGQRVYVSSDLLVYYEEGNPTKFVVPDDFVILDCDPRERRIFKIWEEGKVPGVVFEVTSRGTRREDTSFKPSLYARMGVYELFLYDPTADYLDPPLQGYRLVEGEHQRIEANEAGALECEELGITLQLEQGRLVMHDCGTGELLLTEAEAATARAQDAEAHSEDAEARAEKAEAQIAELQQELESLREQLRRGT